LRKDQRIAHSDRIWRVLRVNECAAYIQEEYTEPKLVEIPGKEPFYSTSGGRHLEISPYSIVEIIP
jgi:hypothetical protein